MSRVKYRKNGFVIFPCGDGNIVYNTRKPFENGHSHLRSFKACKDAIFFVTHKKIPKEVRPYYLTTLKRLSTDPGYRKKIEELLYVRKRKGTKQKYVNQPSFR